MCFCFKNYLLVEVTCLLFRCNETKFFLWNPNNTDRNGVNKQNKQTPKTQRKMTLEMVSYYENKWYPPLLKYPPILPTPSLLWEKIWTRPFSKTFLVGESNYEPGCFWISVFFLIVKMILAITPSLSLNLRFITIQKSILWLRYLPFSLKLIQGLKKYK